MKTFDEGLVSDIRYVLIGEGKRCEVKIKLDGCSTPWLELRSCVTKQYKEFTPPSIDDQAFVHNPNGADNETAYVELGVAYESVCLPVHINENTIVRYTKDGTIYLHDTKLERITLDTPCSLTIASTQNIRLETNKNIVLDAHVEITKNLNVKGIIYDKIGNLTTHKHTVTGHSEAIPRVG